MSCRGKIVLPFYEALNATRILEPFNQLQHYLFAIFKYMFEMLGFLAERVVVMNRVVFDGNLTKCC